jgi:hypothetical protein
MVIKPLNLLNGLEQKFILKSISKTEKRKMAMNPSLTKMENGKSQLDNLAERLI